VHATCLRRPASRCGMRTRLHESWRRPGRGNYLRPSTSRSTRKVGPTVRSRSTATVEASSTTDCTGSTSTVSCSTFPLADGRIAGSPCPADEFDAMWDSVVQPGPSSLLARGIGPWPPDQYGVTLAPAPEGRRQGRAESSPTPPRGGLETHASQTQRVRPCSTRCGTAPTWPSVNCAVFLQVNTRDGRTRTWLT
jgi:hypothetical protein